MAYKYMLTLDAAERRHAIRRYAALPTTITEHGEQSRDCCFADANSMPCRDRLLPCLLRC